MPGLTLEQQVDQTQNVHLVETTNIREEVLNLKNTIDRAFIKMARMLYDIRVNELYVGWGYSNFESYVKGELDYSYRKAAYLVDLWEKMRNLHISAERVESLGWTKCVELSRVITENDASFWIERAENLTFRDLAYEVKQVVDKTYEDSRPHYTIMKLRFDNADITPISDALDDAKRIYETNDIALALSQICLDWLQLQGKVPRASTLDDYIRYLYKVYNVALVPTPISQVDNPDLLKVDPSYGKSEIRKPFKREDRPVFQKPVARAKSDEASIDELLNDDDDDTISKGEESDLLEIL